MNRARLQNWIFSGSLLAAFLLQLMPLPPAAATFRAGPSSTPARASIPS